MTGHLGHLGIPNCRWPLLKAEQGTGAKIEWTSTRRSVGAGRMEIVKSDPNRRVDLAVNFNGLDGTSYYDISPSGSGSKVVWGFSYDSGTSPLKRWKGLMLDRFVGAEYENGLAKLKERIEAERRPTAPSVSTVPPIAVPAPEQPAVVPEQPAVASPDTAPPAATESPAAADPETAQPEAAPAPQ